MSDFITSIKENNSIVIIETNGYLNNVGGEAVSAVVYEKMAQGQTKYLINMAATKIVNSIGVSILIEIIEKLQEVNTDGVEPLIYMTNSHTVLRPDQVKQEITKTEALKNAPKTDGDFFRVPKVIDQQ